MTALTLHVAGERGFLRWTVAGVTVVIAHAAIVAVIVQLYAREPIEPNIIPAIAVTLAPIDASSPEIQDQDIAVGPAMQQAEETPKEPPEQEKPVEKVEQQLSPPQEAEVSLAQSESKEVEKPKPMQPPAPETRAPPKTEHVDQITQASSNAYNALVFGHLQRFKRYPSSARGAQGTVVVRFVLDRVGAVIESAVTKSSGNDVLDHEALEILRRASPFPPFPAAKPGPQDSYIAPVNFAH